MVVVHADVFVPVLGQVAHQVVLVVIQGTGIAIDELGDAGCFRERSGINHF